MNFPNRTLKGLISRLIAASLPVMLAGAAARAEQIHVAVASNFLPVLEILAPEFERQHPHRLRISSASSGVLYQQIIHGAAFDVFLSADSLRPALLEQAGKIAHGSRRSYAIGELVLASKFPDVLPNEAGHGGLESFLRDAPPRSIAIAAVDIAPYGAASKQVYDSFGLWQDAANSRVTMNNISQVATLIATGNVRAGFVARSLLATNNTQWHWHELPDNSYTPIDQQLVILADAKQAGATAFVQFLGDSHAQALIRKSGYRLPDPGK